MNKKIIAFLLAAVMVLALCACGASAAKDVPVSTVAENVNKAISNQNLVQADESIIRGMLKMDTSAYKEACVMINSMGANVDEFGVFVGSDAKQAKEIKDAVDAYLNLRVQSWMDEYMPEEKPKVVNAEAKTVGNYVMYAILSDSDKAAAFGAFEGAVK